MENQTLHYVENGIGWFTLNRPQSLNALSIEMVESLDETLKKWQTDPNVAFVVITGEGEKGFCAGGDMRFFYDQRNDRVKDHAERFFSVEYLMDYMIHEYPKPILVYMNGIVMGGGVGLSIGASERIVNEKTKWAMPEMNLGFFPDVGSSYFLNQMPGAIGTYLALTGDIIQAADIIYIGAADRYMESNRWNDLLNEIKEKNWERANVEAELSALLDRYCSSPENEPSLKLIKSKVDEHFSHETMEEILQSLEAAANAGDEWAKKTKAVLEEKSPTSLKVALRQLQKGKQLSKKECFEMEITIAVNFMDCHDFFEGVRSVLVDKDRNPKWNPASLEEVTDEMVEKFFKE